MDVGFNPESVVLAAFNPQMPGYDRPKVESFYNELLRRARQTAGVERAAYADYVQLGDRGARLPLEIDGIAPPPGENSFSVAFDRISPEYFATLEQSLVIGRDFNDRDGTGAPAVAIVNESLARRFWPGQAPPGKRVRVLGESFDIEIVGVVKDSMFSAYSAEIEPLIFFPVSQRYGTFLTLHIKTSLEFRDAAASITRLVRDIDPNVAPLSVKTMNESMQFRLFPARIARGVLTVSGIVALLLASAGLYGLVAYTLEQRVKEIGIRVALGASRRHVLHEVVGGALKIAGVGIVIGIAVAAAAARLLEAFLYGLRPFDVPTFTTVAILFIMVILVAAYAAARKALNVDPVVALRHE